MPATQDVKAQESKAKKAAATKLYWIGALPRPGTFKYKRPSVAQTAIMNTSTEEFCTYEDATALALWQRWEIWAGLCKYYQNVPVHGMDFPAYTCRPITQEADSPGQRTMMFDPWPGAVVRLTKDKIDFIVSSAKTTYIREENGKDAPNNTSLTVRAFNPELDKKRDHIIDKTGRDIRRTDFRQETLEFDEERDTPVTEFVYIVPLDADPKTNPEDYWTLPRTTMEQFFANPPKSLADSLKDGELS